MNKVMEYKGYIGSCSISLEDGVLHGKLECIDDLITYESDSVLGLRDAFHEAVDDYIEMSQYKALY
ncbi:hypothetical protein [Vibrio echinoideorum]|uniref:hypothetical protein n=1 Tax=Vibrio echinoideorum TaxID=2100116 RepID=UPI0035504B9B